MKKTIAIIAGLFLAVVSAQVMSIQGSRNITAPYVYWDPGSTATDSTMKLVLSNDTLWADSAGTLVDISGDCSYPFFLTDYSVKMSGTVEYDAEPGPNHPLYSQVIMPLIESNRTDSNNLQFTIQTRDWYRELIYGNIYKWNQTAWVPAGQENSGGNFTVKDTILTDASGTTSKVRQKLHFWVTGDEARICPALPATFADAVSDTTIIDSIIYIGR